VTKISAPLTTYLILELVLYVVTLPRWNSLALGYQIPTEVATRVVMWWCVGMSFAPSPTSHIYKAR
jgi:hypothetical protein